MIKQMIALDPSARPTFDTLLHTSRGTVFAESFYSFFHNYVSSINDPPTAPPFSPPSSSSPPTPHIIAPSISISPTIRSATATTHQAGAATVASEIPGEVLPSDSDHRMERIWADYESVEPYLTPDAGEETVSNLKVDYTSSSNSFRAFEVSLNIRKQAKERTLHVVELFAGCHSGRVAHSKPRF